MISHRLSQIILLLALIPISLLGENAPSLRRSGKALTLSEAEQFTLTQVTAGQVADLKSQFPNEADRILRSAFLETLLIQQGTNIHRNGFSIENAVIPEALDLRNAEVHYETRFAHCRFVGEVSFFNISFENGFSVEGSVFERTANFSSMKVGRIAVFDGASFGGEVKASYLEIKGIFTAREAHFNSQTAKVDFASLKTRTDAYFSGATFAGPVSFASSSFGENGSFDRALFSNPASLINFEDVKVGAALTFIDCRFNGYVSFKDAKLGALDFSKVTWPTAPNDSPMLWLNGMTYGRISAGSPTDSWSNLFNLLQRTARGSAYSADVFNRLDDYYRLLGYPRQANAFFRAKKKREREEVLHGPEWAWSYFLEQFVGYGRSPERAILWSVAIIGFGCLVFRPNRMEPQNSEYAGRRYSPFWYSVDVYLPIIKLRDAETWKPKEEYTLTHVWRRIHTVLGWALIPIALAAWTGMLSH
jgi:hypothetical protein